MTIEYVVNLEHHRNAPRIHFQYGIFERLFGKFRRPAPGEPTPPLESRVEESRAVGVKKLLSEESVTPTDDTADRAVEASTPTGSP